MKVKVISMSGLASLRKVTPSGKSYLFFMNKFANVNDKEDLEYFKNKDNFLVEKLSTVELKKATTTLKDVAVKVKDGLKEVYDEVIKTETKEETKDTNMLSSEIPDEPPIVPENTTDNPPSDPDTTENPEESNPEEEAKKAAQKEIDVLKDKLVPLAGIGEEIAEMLAGRYGTIEKLKTLTLEELKALPDIGNRRANKIFYELKKLK